MNRLGRYLLLGLAFTPLFAQAAGFGASGWKLCPPMKQPSVPVYGDRLIHVLADQAFLKANGASNLRGNVIISRGDQSLLSNDIIYNSRSSVAVSISKVTLETPSLKIQAASGQFNLAKRTGKLNDVRYQYYPAHAQGKAREVERKDNTLTTLTDATYSTCPIGHEAWVLSASSLRLNQKADVGTARNVTLRFKGVPILYSPWLSFPLSKKRKSGLLTPLFGESSNSGFIYKQPIYWNIAPWVDATFTPQLYSKRGVAMGTQFRYLTTHSYSVVNGNYLPHDRQTNHSRWFYSMQQHTEPLPGLSTRIDYSRVSDDAYFNDLVDPLTGGTTTQLKQSFNGVYRTPYWKLGTQFLKYQILDPTLTTNELPYEKLPEITFSGQLPATPGALQASLNSRLTNFQRPDSVTGWRANITPTLRLPLSGSAWFATPTLKYYYIGYRLNNQTPGSPSAPSLNVPSFSLDSGLYFDRNVGTRWIQTLEPRAYYLYVPYRNQQNLPVFDTSLNDFSYSQLFSDNRFSGGDRVGDANQLSLALTTRLIDASTGKERLSASIGQIFYFRSRRVTLPGEPVATQRRSDYAGRLRLALAQHWEGHASATFDPYSGKFDTAYYGLQYHLDPQRLINVGYQLNRGTTNQVNVSFLWPITPRWQSASRVDYSLRERRILDAFVGLQYNSCCWAARVLARRYINTVTGTYNNGIYFELVLKGLGGLGNSIGTYIQRNIPAYATSS